MFAAASEKFVEGVAKDTSYINVQSVAAAIDCKLLNVVVKQKNEKNILQKSVALFSKTTKYKYIPQNYALHEILTDRQGEF